MILESLKYNSEMVNMITLTAEIDKDVIYEDYDEHVQVLLEHTIHQVHECCWGIVKTKERDQEFKVNIPSTGSYFWNVTFSDSKLIVARSEFYFLEIARTLKLVKQVIDSAKWMLAFDCEFVELVVINSHSERTIFLSQK
ncbi:hypothetical protein CQW23_21886 [Capsicum baccatum]|uniref:Uncharacterized protein n=1 Tax=Capsicum baccatum TaxID=33114 RepID=A0A2G2VZE4_CAPBA|nr:hypothetical protein CQW23_21886 [Capsicum baccatum]